MHTLNEEDLAFEKLSDTYQYVLILRDTVLYDFGNKLKFDRLSCSFLAKLTVDSVGCYFFSAIRVYVRIHLPFAINYNCFADYGLTLKITYVTY